MTRSLLAGLLLALSASALAAVPPSVTGIPTVIDGDTLGFGALRVRLSGIDAPESSQTCQRAGASHRCGQQAALALDALIARRTVHCVRQDTDRYGRMLGVCTVGGAELNRQLVLQGWAVPYLQYGGAGYGPAAVSAKTQRLGLHAGTFQNPWDYRAAPASPPTAPTAPRPVTAPASGGGAVYYANCAAARAAGAAPVRQGQPGYRPALDRDHDGIGCE